MIDEQYLKELGVGELPEDAKRPLVENLEKQIQDRVSLKMAEGLSDEKLNELADLTDGEGDNTEKVAEWLKVNVPGYVELVQGVMAEVKAEILATREKALGE